MIGGLDINLRLFLPELIIALTAVVVLAIDLFWKENRHIELTIASICGLAISGVSVFLLRDEISKTLAGNIISDPFAVFFKFLFIIGAAAIIVISRDYFKNNRFAPGEYIALILFALMGMMIMVSSTDLLVLFLGIEISSISSYILAGYYKDNFKSNEAALKYFVLGIIASAIMLYGISFIYGTTGETQMTAISTKIIEAKSLVTVLGVILLLVGVSFKFAAAPFHQWVPDVYEGAPTPITAFLSTGPKLAAIGVLVRVLFVGFPVYIEYWRTVFIILAVLSMFVGNLMAISQKNIKRMLAYSSIAHVGYILIGVVVASEMALTGIFFYAVAYVLMNIGAFTVVVGASQGKDLEDLDNYKGLSRRSPFLALNMALFMVALIGLPPTSGLWGKVYIFASAIEKDFLWLAIVGLINSAISMYYYANVIRHMYLLEPVDDSDVAVSAPVRSVTVIAAIGVLLLGIFPQKLIELAHFSSWLEGLIK